MSIAVNKIQLKNWFNYKGEYELNTFEFSKGLNIIVGDNNSGKSKLHSAFRFILTNSVYLELADGYSDCEVTNLNISDIFNKSSFREMKNNTSEKMGIKIYFTENSNNYGERDFLLVRELTCRKDAAKLNITNTNETVFLIDPRTKSPKRLAENFSDFASKIIPRNFLNFFLIEGEQLGLMTPLEGKNLKETINSIVEISFLDELEETARYIKDKVGEKKTLIELSEKNLTQERRSYLEKITSLKEEIKEQEDSILHFKDSMETNQALVEQYRTAATNSKKAKELLGKMNELETQIKVSEEKVSSRFNSFIGDLINPYSFNLSKCTDDTPLDNSIGLHIEKIKSFIRARRAELKNILSAKEEKMIMALEKSQPKPEIIQQMIDEGDCYVCNNSLSEASRDYMLNKLIPFFRDELDDDSEVNNLVAISDLLGNLYRNSKKYYHQDLAYFDDFNEGIAKLISDKNDLETRRNLFIKDNGNVEINDEVSLATYDTATKKVTDNKNVIDNLIVQRNENLKTLRLFEGKISNTETTESEPLKKAKDLLNFTTLLSEAFLSIRDSEYSKFASMLEDKATMRFQSFMTNNIAAKNLKIRVHKEQNAKKQYEFKINVVNSFGEIQEQPGGADQALRRVAVVFGLLDITESKRGYPFIADAPISKLSPDTKKVFFKSLINDSALSQFIILNMDLWSSDKHEINDIGTDVLQFVSELPNSKFITILPKSGNNGVEINYLKK